MMNMTVAEEKEFLQKELILPQNKKTNKDRKYTPRFFCKNNHPLSFLYIRKTRELNPRRFEGMFYCPECKQILNKSDLEKSN